MSLRKLGGNYDNDPLVMDNNIPRIDPSSVKSKDKEKVERMRRRKNKKKGLLYPED